MFGFFRVAAACPSTVPADPNGNARAIIAAAKEAASKGAGLVVFPELSITGAYCGDLFGHTSLLYGAEEALRHVLAETAGLDALLVIGAPLRKAGAVYNCAVFAHRGQVAGISSIKGAMGRVLRPRPADCGWPAPFNEVFALSVDTGAGITVGTEGSGAAVVVVPYAGHMYAGVHADDTAALKSMSKRDNAAYIRSCAGPGESTGEGLCGGGLIIAENGEVLAEARPLSGTMLIYADVDGEIVRGRPVSGDASITVSQSCHPPLLRPVSPMPFLPRDKKDWPDFCGDILSLQAVALAKRIERAAAKKAVINVSGGLDSALALLAAAGAMDALGRSRADIIGLSLPGFGTTGRTNKNAMRLMTALGVTIREINITSACERHFSDIGLDASSKNVAFENAQARERTQIAMDIANMEGGFMVGTGNMSEAALGFSTFGGDHLSMYNPNAGITKTAARAVVRHAAQTLAFGSDARDAMLDILDTPVSPELLPASGGPQLTESLVGPYELHDFFLYHIVKNGFSPEKTSFLAETAFAGRYAPDEINRWLALFVKRFYANQYKRSCSPEGPAVLGFSLSPRSGFSMPGDVVPPRN